MKTESNLSLKWNKKGSMCSFTQWKLFFFPWLGGKEKENTKEKLLKHKKNKNTIRETGSAIGSAIKSYIIFQLKHQQPHLGSSHPLLKNSISAQAGTFSPCSNQDILGCAHTSWLSSQACISYYFLLLPIRPAGRPQAWQIPLFFLDPLTSTVFRSRETVPGSGKALPASSLTATLTLLAKQSCSCCCLTDPSFREPVMHAAYIYSLNLGKEQAIMVR